MTLLFKKFKDKIILEDTGYRIISGVMVSLITVMDTYLFTYMGA